MQIYVATQEDVFRIEPIFNLYRDFYGAKIDQDAALFFLKQRIQNKESIIFYAQQNNEIVGFVQIFKTFSSASLSRVLVLNDLFVVESARNHGVASALIKKVLDLARQEQCSRISLSTAQDNPAQKLYEKIGFRESRFKFYNYNV